MKLSLSVALLWLLEHSAFAWDGTSFCDNSRYLLEWSDEFDGASLDESKWSTVLTFVPSDIVIITVSTLLLLCEKQYLIL
jgi:hypothetical protein